MIYMKNRLKLIPGLVFITLLDIGCEKGPIVRLYEEPIIANLSGLGQTLYTSDDPTKTNWKDRSKSYAASTIEKGVFECARVCHRKAASK